MRRGSWLRTGPRAWVMFGVVLFAVAGCRTEVEPEARLALALEPAGEGELHLQHTITFADGATLQDIRLTPEVARPGGRVSVRFTPQGAAGGPARVGLLPPVEASRQYITDMGASRSGGVEDARAQWQTITLGEDPSEVIFELPEVWNPRSAVFVLERRAGAEGPAVEVVQGPRSEAPRTDGYRPGVRARLGTLPVEVAPLSFELPRVGAPPKIDGVLDEPAWSGPGFELVESLEGEPVPVDRTQVWFGWDDEALYVAARLDDRDIWSEYEKRDDPLYRQEAFEIFIAGGPSVERYLEYQVSPRNVIFDAAFKGHRNGDEAFDGMWRHAVKVDGTVSQRGDRDRAWTVEAAFDWAELCAQTRLACPVSTGTPLRINVFRLDKDAKGRQRGQALSPTREPDFHHWASAAKVTLGGAR